MCNLETFRSWEQCCHYTVNSTYCSVIYIFVVLLFIIVSLRFYYHVACKTYKNYYHKQTSSASYESYNFHNKIIFHTNKFQYRRQWHSWRWEHVLHTTRKTEFQIPAIIHLILRCKPFYRWILSSRSFHLQHDRHSKCYNEVKTFHPVCLPYFRIWLKDKQPVFVKFNIYINH